jgi:hypothetical protein
MHGTSKYGDCLAKGMRGKPRSRPGNAQTAVMAEYLSGDRLRQNDTTAVRAATTRSSK